MSQKGEPKPYVAMLPALTADELEELQYALKDRVHLLAAMQKKKQGEYAEKTLTRLITSEQICAFLLTAVLEARLSIHPRDDT